MNEKMDSVQEYMIVPLAFFDGQRYVIYRKLPAWEYLQYYRDRKKEICIDMDGEHWLWLYECVTLSSANDELRRLAGPNRIQRTHKGRNKRIS